LGHQILQSADRAEQVVFELFLRLWHESDQFDSSQEIKTRLLQNAYAIAKAQLPPAVSVGGHWENLTDIELEETLSTPPAPAEALETLKSKLMATIEPAGSGVTGPSRHTSPDGRRDAVYSGVSQDQLKEESRGSKGGRGRSLWPILAFGFGIAASILAVYSSYNTRKLFHQLRELAVASIAQQQELKIAQTKLGFVLSPQTEVLVLTGQPAAPQARAKLVWDPAEGQGFFTVTGLAPLPPEKSYQLWVIAGGKPVSIKTFEVDSAGAAEIRFAHLPPSEYVFAFSVTVEPAGGVAEPTGEKLLSVTRL
ncbi:MAG: anti-sigma factor domain-containing protein, partial [Limisphaerales bacterium]